MEITSIEVLFNLYGIVVKARMGRKPYSFPPCLIEPIEKENEKYQLIDDYKLWFSIGKRVTVFMASFLT